MINPAESSHFTSPLAGNTATRVISSRAAILRSVIINNMGAAGSTGSNITIYNNTAASGDVVAVIDPADTFLSRTLVYNIACPKGLTVKTTAGPLGGSTGDFTVTYEAPEV